MKTITFALVHFCVAFSIAWLLTGSMLIGGLMALVEPMVNTVAFHFHEKAWTRWNARAHMRPAPTGLAGT